MMSLIDCTRPALIASLHNAEFGGGFFYTSGGDPGVLVGASRPPPTCRSTAANLDAPGARTLAPGVFELPLFEAMADSRRKAWTRSRRWAGWLPGLRGALRHGDPGL